ncbi:MAG: nucleotidyltransferase family protein [Muribaculaceae bacterium]|nr:nucleotidyltransferase family protein [Muribaculaceae bacterium]
MKAMVFAAGEGNRLRPLTLTRPKALVEVGGKPMLARVLENVRAAGIREVVVNVHYLADMIVDFLAENDFGLKISIADERGRLLDTGGGLLAARHLLDGNEPILLHNADICTDLDLSRLAPRGVANLLVGDRQSSRRLIFDADNRLTGWINELTGETRGNAIGERLAFNGIHVVAPEIFPLLEDYSRSIGSDVFSLTPFYVSVASRHAIYGSRLSGYRWHDVGNMQKLEAANADFK